ncbi:DUF6445 family protein [Algimonas porphyrae]|uniref:Uncharacterized protein n=1 Tax=Algimonas porphyrae TaxID=1128113 RepID=A0ABQ5V510_9PROT|nr:DUF6445 family protein [Algimonas porphyrae]GLQ21770.1 hypothetical protein GCM10007854_27250 [Algimonas porphyrae]
MADPARYSVQTFGSTGQPVVIIDDFHPEMDQLHRMASHSNYRRLGPHYPGVQAPADPRYINPVGPLLSGIFAKEFGITSGVKLVQCSFSMVTTPDDALNPIQRLPHVDTTDPGRIALLHYLSDETTGGTAFYKHRATGLDVLDQSNFETYRTALQAEGQPKAGYMRGSDDRFEMIGHVSAKINRAILYRSQLLHSGMIPEDLPFSDTPSEARLTLNSFFQA